jgi:AcrR family transcriptional regulator
MIDTTGYQMIDTTVTPAKKRERADAAANHARIIAAAQAVFAERGLDAEMREIAERAGVAVGTLYRHFVDRDDLQRAVLDAISAEIITRLEVAAASDDPRDAVRAVVQTFGAIHKQFQATVALMRDPRREKRIAATPSKNRECLTRATAVIVDLITRGIGTGVFRPDLDPHLVAPALLGAMLAFESLAAERGYDAVRDPLADFYLAALTPADVRFSHTIALCGGSAASRRHP